MKAVRVARFLWRVDTYWGSATAMTRRGAIRRARKLPYQLDTGWTFRDEPLPAWFIGHVQRKNQRRR